VLRLFIKNRRSFGSALAKEPKLQEEEEEGGGAKKWSKGRVG